MSLPPLGKVAQAVVVLATIPALITLKTNVPEDLSRYTIYLLSQAWLDTLCLLALSALAWVSYRSTSLRQLLRDPLRSLRTASGGFHVKNCVAVVVCAALLVSVGIHGYGLMRVRGVFWKHLAQKSYVEDVLAEIDGLSTSGRVHDAYVLAKQARGILSDESNQSRISNRFGDLAVRVELSARLSQRYLQPRAEAWNPITQRAAFFANAEAVRLDPQNHQALEVLDHLYVRVVEGMAHDSDQLCGPDRPRSFETVSVLEAEEFLGRNHRDCEQAAFLWLNRVWQPERIRALLEEAKDIRDFKVGKAQRGS